MAPLTQARLKEVLNYDPETGVFTWKARANVQWDARYAGATAGCENGQGYILICIDGCLYRAHRLAWLYVHGEWVPNLDHKDTIRSHNRMDNLRPATQSQNLGNQRKSKINTSGFKGVHWHKGGKRWAAGIRLHGRSTHLGLFDTPEAAYAAYCEAARERFGEFARFE